MHLIEAACPEIKARTKVREGNMLSGNKSSYQGKTNYQWRRKELDSSRDSCSLTTLPIWKLNKLLTGQRSQTNVFNREVHFDREIDCAWSRKLPTAAAQWRIKKSISPVVKDVHDVKLLIWKTPIRKLSYFLQINIRMSFHDALTCSWGKKKAEKWGNQDQCNFSKKRTTRHQENK